MQPIALVFVVVALTVYAQLVVKARAIAHAAELAASGALHYLVSMFTDPWVLSGIAGALIGGACWMVAISRLDVGYAFPFIALSFVLVPIGSRLLFNEPLPPLQLLGLALIVGGVSISALAR